MNELHLVVDSGRKDKETGEVIHSVICTAKFSTHDEAVKFHASVADLCRNTVPRDSIPWGMKRLMLINASQRP